jgi:hypothetical protein
MEAYTDRKGQQNSQRIAGSPPGIQCRHGHVARFNLTFPPQSSDEIVLNDVNVYIRVQTK